MFVLVMALLATLALPLGGLLRSQPPLRAYALDIGGSIVGIALFALLSALSLPPPIWFGLLAVLFLGLTLRHRSTGRSLANAALLVVAVAAVTVGGAQSGDLWSPYYRITVQDQPGANTTILVNGIPHQELHRVADASGERFYRAGLPLVPRADVRQRARRRRGQRHRRRVRDRAWHPAS